ncbi:MAG: AAA family ATPase [Thermoplasmata archaeon]
MAQRIGIAGKGGVGKSTLAGTLARLLARRGKKVLAVDIDPSPSLASAVGVPENERKNLVPLSQMLDLIEERTGVRPGSSYGQMFRLNPKVDDLVEEYGIIAKDGVRLIVLGTIDVGGSGCFCPENALLKRLLKHLVLDRGEVLIMDMEAGVEHLGRGTAEGVDVLVIVVEPGRKSIETAERIRKLAVDVGITKIVAVLNKSLGEDDFTRSKLAEIGIEMIGSIPYMQCMIEADVKDVPPIDHEDCSEIVSAIEELEKNLGLAG